MPAQEIAPAAQVTEPPIPAADRRHRIEEALVDARARLAADVARYEDLVARGDAAVPAWDDRPGRLRGRHVALALMHNHIASHKGLVATLEAMLAREPRGPSERLREEIRRLHALGLFTPAQMARKFKLDLATVKRLLGAES